MLCICIIWVIWYTPSMKTAEASMGLKGMLNKKLFGKKKGKKKKMVEDTDNDEK